MIYDIIGDIHGQADKLKGLLQQLNYQHNGTFYQPPENHCAIFVGDFIDRGAKQLETLEIVFAMLDAGVAYAVMGNHEYNALAYATLDPHNPEQYLRSHSQKNTHQHQAFLDEVGFGSDLHQYWLKRFYELPLWLELEECCVVHACWDVDSMQVLRPYLTPDLRLTEQGLQVTSYKHSPEYNALERVLKGVETDLPDGLHFFDKDGHARYNVRVQWWKQPLSYQPIHQIARVSRSDLVHIPPETLSGEVDFYLTTEKPIFVGHFWLNDVPQPLSSQVVCVDYSAGKDGHLTAYQFDTEHLTISEQHFVQYQHG